jgi:subtilisin
VNDISRISFGRSLVLPLAATALVAFLAAGASAAPGQVDVLIGFSSPPNAEDVAIVRAIGGRVKHVHRIVPAIAASVPEAALNGLARDRRVRVIEADGLFHAINHTAPSNSAELNNTWGVKHIGAGQVHASGITGVGVKVAVLDTGVDYTHPDLAGRIAGGYDFINNDSDPMDDHGHGTHVAGTVAANADGSGVVGAAPAVQVYALKVLGANGSGSFSAVIAALDWCVANEVHISNSSLGANQDPGTIVRAAFDNAAAAGVLHIAAAGNSGNSSAKGNSVSFPARYDSVVAVGATTQGDTRATFSSTGPAVELSAPGASINSTRLGGGYALFSGTSMASPHVAGVAALVIASGVGDLNGNGVINDDVRLILRESARDLGAVGRDNEYGFGLVDAVAATAVVTPPPPPPPNSAPAVVIASPADHASFAAGQTITFSGSANDVEDGDLTTGLTWTSSLDGNLGSGGSFSTSTLSAGTHVITASVTDSAGAAGAASITVSVTAPLPSAIRVASITYSTSGGKNNKDLLVHLQVVDEIGGAVGGVSVSINLYRNGGLAATGTGTTASNGVCTFTYRNAPSGSYSTVLTALSAAGYTWDGVTPANSFTK